MTGEQDTGNPAWLPLAERARRGLLAGESELWIHEIAELEYPNLTDKTERDDWERLLHGLTVHGLFPGSSMRSLERSEYRLCPVKNRVTIVAWRIPREAYRAWRATQHSTPAGSLIHLWLSPLPQGEPAPLPQGEPDRPEQGAAGTQNPATNRQCVADKARFLDLATWEGTQQATVNQHPEAAYFKGKYDAPALLKWASEIDPRPKDQRGGRPRKS